MESLEKIHPQNNVAGLDYENIPKIDVDLSGCWNNDSMSEVLIPIIKSMPFYRGDLLYSGFNANSIGKKEPPKSIFCATEDTLFGNEETNDPFYYAIKYKNPAIAIYDPTKMERKNNEAFTPTDSSALLGIILLKGL